MDTPSVDRSTTMSVETLYRSHAAEIFRYAFAMLGNRADAEDVTQATFVNAMRAIERHGEPHTPSNWLITIAHNIVRQRFRRQQSRPTEVELESEIEAAEIEQSETSIDDLVRALQRIPPNQREALVMRELEGRPYREIAAMLDLSLSAVETLIFRARRSLAEELDNLVTCDRAELALSQRSEARLSRKDRRRLEEHLRECPSCAELAARQTRFQDAFKRLALLPAPVGLPSFGGPGAAVATGAGTAAAAGVGSTVAASGSTVVLGGAAAKFAVAAAAIVAAGGVGYHVEHAPRAHAAATRPAVRPAAHASMRPTSHANGPGTQAATTAARQIRAVVPHPRRLVAAAAPAPAPAAPVVGEPGATDPAPAALEHRSDRAQAVQTAHAEGRQPAPPSDQPGAGRSAQGAASSAAAPGQAKKAETARAAPAAAPAAARAPKVPNPNANAAASKPAGTPAVPADPSPGAKAAAKPKIEPNPKPAPSPSPADVPVTTTAATTTTPPPASPPPDQGQPQGQGQTKRR